jgi:spore germination cell wall hydrolase CwlJ-like protein
MKLINFLRNPRVENVLAAILIFISAILIMANTEVIFEEEEQQIVAAPKPQPKPVDPKQLKCLATNIFYEAGSESEKGKQAVARVVMNRINYGFASDPCSVVYQVSTVLRPVIVDPDSEYDGEPFKKVKLCQFSWVCESNRKPLNPNDPRYKQSERIAHNVLAHDSYKEVIPSTVLFFHNLWVNPMWPYKKVAQIGNHIFYEKPKKQPKAQKPKILAAA